MTQASAPQEATNETRNKAELLERMRSARQVLEQTLAGLDEAALAAPGPEGWSVKDHLAHLAAWERKVLGNMEGRPGHAVLGVPEDVYKRGDWIEINEFVRAPDKERPVPEVLAEFRRVHQRLAQRVAELPDEQLFGDDRQLLSNIEGNSFGHDEEHKPWIEAVLKHNAPA